MARGRRGRAVPPDVREQLDADLLSDVLTGRLRIPEALALQEERDAQEPADGPEENGQQPAQPSGTFDDLIQEDTFRGERGTLTIPADDLPVEVDALPIPAPYQGLRRAAMVFNFNFVWDSAEEQWVRDTGNSGGAGGAIGDVLESQQGSVSDNNSSFDTTGISDPTLWLQLYFRIRNSPGGTNTIVLSPGLTDSLGNLLEYDLRFDQSLGRWRVGIINQSGNNIDYEWQIREVTAP